MADQFLYRSDVPIYRVTRAEATPLEHGQTRKEYQVRVGIRNITEARGVAGVTVVVEKDKIEKKIPMEPNEEKEWILVTTAKPQRVEVNAFIAGARNKVQKKFTHLPTPIESEGENKVIVIDTGEKNGKLEIVVDDLDPGFSTAKIKPGGKRISKEVRSWEKAYPQWLGFGRPRNWRTRFDAEAYGIFYLTSKVKRSGSGNELACWKTDITEPGKYQVYVHLADSRNMSLLAKAGTYLYSIRQGETELEVELDMESIRGGWNRLGKIELVSGEPAVVELTDKANRGGLIMADAVKWVRGVDEESE